MHSNETELGLALVARSIVRQVTVRHLTPESYYTSLAKDIVLEVTWKVIHRLKREDQERIATARLVRHLRSGDANSRGPLLYHYRLPEDRSWEIIYSALEATVGRQEEESLDSWLLRFEEAVEVRLPEGAGLDFSWGRLFRELQARASSEDPRVTRGIFP